MKQFKNFKIQPNSTSFEGDKIEMYQVLNKQIIVYDYKIEPSKFTGKGNGKCLHLQIGFENKKRVIFTGSGKLMEAIEQVSKDDFPFETIITKENKKTLFT